MYSTQQKLEDDIGISFVEHVAAAAGTASDAVVAVRLDALGGRGLVGRRAVRVGLGCIALLLALDLLEAEELLTALLALFVKARLEA